MQRVGLTRASFVFPIVAVLERFGAPVDRLLASAGLPAWVLADAEALIPTASAARLLAEGARNEGIENLGTLSGREAKIEILGTYGRLIRHSRTLGDALQEMVHEHRAFASDGEMWLVSRNEDVLLRHAFTGRFDPSDYGWQQATHFVLMLMLGVIRLAAGRAWRPLEVHLQTTEPAALRDAGSLPIAHVAFGQPATAIALPRALCDDPLRQPTAALEIHDIDRWRTSAPSLDFVRSVGQVVEMLSWERYPDIHQTAKVLGMTARTLQRHLAAAGVTHASLVGRTRFATAAALLRETDTKVLEIALDLGYSDHAHFTRAFRRWAGCSPQEYRGRRAEGRTAFRRSGP